MANVVKKYSISSELAQKMVDATVAHTESGRQLTVVKALEAKDPQWPAASMRSRQQFDTLFNR